MTKRIFLKTSLALAAGLLVCSAAMADTVLRVLTHSSYSLPKPLVVQFEVQSGIKLAVVKAGDAGEMLNKLILTKAAPIADVVYGIDSTLVAKARAAQVLEAWAGSASAPTNDASLGADLVAVNYGFVNLNFDKAAVAKRGVALPKSLEDLTAAAYRNWLVVQNPATSSPGYAFLLATIAGMGEEKAFDWWAKMRANGMKVAKGWTEAYYTDFSQNGGTYPLVVSYATSPAAEVFYSKEKINEPPTGNLFVKGGVYRQVEGVALIKGGAQRESAIKFVEFLRSAQVQDGLQTSMWMYPAQPGAPRVEAMRHAPEPTAFEVLSPQDVADKGAAWVARWTKVVLK